MHMASGVRRWAVWVLCPMGLLVSGCHLLFGDYRVDSSAAGTGNTPAQTSSIGGSPLPPGPCASNGVHRCNGAKLEICQDHAWTEKRSCPTAVQCDADRGECRPCESRTWRCFGNLLQQCTASGDGWTPIKACATSDLCDAEAHTCATCVSDEALCNLQYLNVCNATHTGWDVTDCEDPNLCNTTSRSCRPCSTGEYQCSQATLQRCDEEQQWENADQCASNALCQASLKARSEQSTAWSGRCTQAICTAGDYRCNPDNNARLETCPLGRDRWEYVQDCVTAALCDAAHGRCTLGCSPGTYKCTGAQLQRCLADGTKYELVQRCPSSAQCNVEKKTCTPCVAGEYQCNAELLQRCTASQTWETVEACDTIELCNLGKPAHACQPKGCLQAGDERCSGSVLQSCPASLVAWQDKQTCENSELCDAIKTACVPPVCTTAGEYRCSGQVRERCNQTRSAWIPEPACAEDQICLAARGCVDQCPSPSTQCNGTRVEQCSIDPATQKLTWMLLDTCLTPELCQSNETDTTVACQKKACDPTQYRCTGQNLEICNAGQTGWDPVKTCAASEICDQISGQCDKCVANTYTCSGATLSRCAADGQSLSILNEQCASCSTSADRLSEYCYVCNTGDAQCYGTSQIQSCAEDRRGWSAATGCDNGCQGVPGASSAFCAACPEAGRTACTADGMGIHTCASDRSAWSATTTCPYGCTDNVGVDDVCNTACTAGATKCELVDGLSTGLNTCATDGSGWLGIKQQCADTGSLKRCAGGAFVTGDPVSCATTKSHCVGGQCVECIAAAPECTDNNTTSQICTDGVWVPTQCVGSCDPGSGLCVECTTASASTCVAGGRRHCVDNAWVTEACPAATPTCLSGTCVECLDSGWECQDNRVLRRCFNGSWEEQTCAAPTPACFVTACVACAANEDCGSNATCQSNVCIPTEVPDLAAGGASGVSGISGISGISGVSGARGISGASGASGISGGAGDGG